MTPTTEPPATEDVLAALHRSHGRLVAALASLTDEQVAGPSYADEWPIAQVASHLGSGAEVFGLFLDAGLRQAAAPGVEQFQPIWDRWNAKPPPAQARDAFDAVAAFLARLDALNAEQRRSWRLDLFGTEQTSPVCCACAWAKTPCTPGTSRSPSTRPPPCPRTRQVC